MLLDELQASGGSIAFIAGIVFVLRIWWLVKKGKVVISFAEGNNPQCATQCPPQCPTVDEKRFTKIEESLNNGRKRFAAGDTQIQLIGKDIGHIKKDVDTIKDSVKTLNDTMLDARRKNGW